MVSDSDKLDDHVADRFRTHLATTARDAVLLRRQYLSTAGMVKSCGAFGGLPRLPDGIEWPRSRADDSPLHFVAEIELDALPMFSERSLLPASGSLSFFIETNMEGFYDEQVACAVIYSPEHLASTPLRSAPDGLSEILYGCGLEVHRTPKCFPRFAVNPVVVPTYNLDIPDWAIEALGRNRVGDIFRLVERTAALEAFGLSSVDTQYMHAGTGIMQRYKQNTDRNYMKSGDGVPFPDRAWPYSWLFVEHFVETWTEREAIKDLGGWSWPDQAGALGWLKKAHHADTLGALQQAEHGQFRAWCDDQLRSKPSLLSGMSELFNSNIAYCHVWMVSAQGRSGSTMPDHLSNLMREFHLPLRSSPDGTDFDITRHQMLGNAHIAQDISKQLSSSAVLLLQLDSDAGMLWSWGDEGQFQFWMTCDDLAKKNFSCAKLVFSSH